MNMAPGMEHASADKEFVKNTNRISTILSNNTRPGKTIFRERKKLEKIKYKGAYRALLGSSWAVSYL